jgi:hypothetical protein
LDEEVISEEMLAERYLSSPFAKPMDEFMRRWLEEHCDAGDLLLMKAVWAHLWGPGPLTTHTGYLRATQGREPTHEEVAALMEHTLRILEPCNEAWCESPEYRQLHRTHYGWSL